MNNVPSTPWWSLQQSDQTTIFAVKGRWLLSAYEDIVNSFSALADLAHTHHKRIQIDGSALQTLDTAGALALLRVLGERGIPRNQIDFINFQPSQQNIITLVASRWKLEECNGLHPASHSMFHQIGEATLYLAETMRSLLSFIGAVVTLALRTVKDPRLFRYKEFTVQLESVFVDAIPIVSLVAALIGVVLAYLFAMQLVYYGASIFVVDGVVIAMCRELGPLMVAVTVAGRSGSAFTAQLGTMKLNQEIDAMITLGLSPIRILVLPRVVALIIAMPLLVFIADIVGVMGGFLVSQWYVGISSYAFFDRIQDYFRMRHFYIGMVKAPVFAAFIAVIGCKMGLTVENNARSVGIHTTSTVVQSIVSVIILDAIFAVIVAQFGW